MHCPIGKFVFGWIKGRFWADCLITCSSTVHSWLNVSGLFWWYGLPLIIYKTHTNTHTCLIWNAHLICSLSPKLCLQEQLSRRVNEAALPVSCFRMRRVPGRRWKVETSTEQIRRSPSWNRSDFLVLLVRPLWADGVESQHRWSVSNTRFWLVYMMLSVH